MLLNGWRTLRLIQSARQTSTWTPERLQRRQQDQLAALLVHAYNHVPLYRALYDEAGFHPSHFRSMADLEKIPRLPKARLKNARAEEVVAAKTNPKTCEIVRTSGSTGVPLNVYLGPSEICWHRAAAWRIMFEHGYRWTDRTLEIRMALGPRFRIQQLGIAPKDWLSILDPPESWARQLADGIYQVIIASSSTLQLLAQTVPALGLNITPPRLIISDSETLTPATRQLVARTLGANPVDVFGLVELSNFAWECEQRNGYHISADSHIVEVDAPGGVVGELIVTGLGMRTMPIIRYETGDLASARVSSCACGRTLPMLQQVVGRTIDAVLLPDGRRLLWPYFHEVLACFDTLLQWQVIQETPKRLRVQLVLPQPDTKLMERIRADLTRALPPEMVVELEPVPAITAHRGEKIRPVISKVSEVEPQSVRLLK